jgi:hypothetical protein
MTMLHLYVCYFHHDKVTGKNQAKHHANDGGGNEVSG